MQKIKVTLHRVSTKERLKKIGQTWAFGRSGGGRGQRGFERPNLLYGLFCRC